MNKKQFSNDVLRIDAEKEVEKICKRLREFLAKKLKIPRNHLSIQSGIRSRAKTVVIGGISKAEVLEGLKVV